MHRRRLTERAICLLTAGILGVGLAQAADGLPTANWPQWRGPARDGISPETGLLKQWQAGGPKLLWTATGCGKGFSTVTIQDGLIYTAGVVGKQTFVLAFDRDGKPV